MGRLFWKFFLFIWLGQMAAVFGTGALFWAERQQFEARMQAGGFAPPPHFTDRPSPEFDRPPPGHAPDSPNFGSPPGPPRHGPGSGGLPILPMLAGLLASLICAAGLAWYFAKPIRHLRQAFETAAEGDLAVRVSPLMAGRRDELADLGLEFDRMSEQLGVVMFGQRRLLHDVSHEMRSPLARLQAAIGLARQQPARIDDTLSRIEREGERMNLLVGELLTLSRLDAGVGQPVEPVELGDLLTDIVEDARFEGAERRVSVAYMPGEMATLQANSDLLHRAIENVVRNALRFSPPGGCVDIAAGRGADGDFCIAIGDNGPGVPEAQLDLIFQPFFRADLVGSEAPNGAGLANGYGLGLAIAQRVIATVYGRILAKINRQTGCWLRSNCR
jgi:signal transduction histidine kinase